MSDVVQPARLERTVEAAAARLHPIGWVAAAFGVLAILFHTVLESPYLVGNMALWHWLVMLGLIALAALPGLLNAIRVAIESISSVTKAIAWVLVWVVFIVQFFNVTTRYGNDLVEQDIYYGEAVSVAWQSFALIAILGMNYGTRDGVNPRIDFWWAEFSDKVKAALDFTIHALLLMPFVIMAVRLLRPYATIALGQRRDGEWPDGWQVWNSWEGAPDAGALAVGPIKAMLVVAFFLFGLQVFAELIKTGFVLAGRPEFGKMASNDAPMRIE